MLAQDLGNGTLLGTTEEKALADAALRKQMRKRAKTAKILDTAVYPTVAAEMRMRGADSYPQLLERGRAFVSALTGKTAAFIEYGAAATVLEDLQAAVAALEAAINRKDTALITRVGSTAGLGVFTRAGARVVRKLDAIMSVAYDEDPVLLAGWKSAKRDRRDTPAVEEPVAPATPSSVG